MDAKNESLEVQPYDWVSEDRDGIFTIRIWSLNRESERVLLRVENYQPFCRIELPSVVQGKHVKWNIDALKVYAQWLRQRLGNDQPESITYQEQEKLYNFDNHKKYPFLVCKFQNENAMVHCTRLINKTGYKIDQLGYVRARVYETSVTSIHRMVNDCHIGYGNWLRVNAEQVPELDKISHCPNEYIVNYEDLIKVPDEECGGWTTKPKIGAYDIETYSRNHKTFPNKNYATDVVFQISYISQILGDHSTRKRYLLVVGPCDEINDAEVIHFDHETQLIDGLCDLIVEDDPTVMIGYNNFRFDLPYLEARMDLYMKDWKPCGLIKDQGTRINSRSWKSGAYGFMNISTLEAEGRLNLDMYPIIKRDHKLDRYTLDYVSHHFLGRGKHDVSARQMFEAYERSMIARKEEDKEKLRQVAEEMGVIGDYCLEDACLCIDLMEKTNTWIALVELSTIVQVPIMSIFTRGQQIRVYNQIYSYAFADGVILDERDSSISGFTGGWVPEPKAGKWKNVWLFDFASLYPNLIRLFNICYTTLVPPESQIPDEMCHVLRFTQMETDPNDKKKEIEVAYCYRFIKQEYFVGILPRMCADLINARKAVRKQIGPNNDEVTNVVLNQRQLGIKVSANSIFGFTAAQKLPCMELSRSITAMGRQLINESADHVKNNHNLELVYGDTDSIMIHSDTIDPYKGYEKGKVIEKELTDLFPDPIDMELEGTFSIALFIAKKKYVAIMMAVYELKEGDEFFEVPFDEEHYIQEMKLYQVNMHRNGKLIVKYVAIPDFVDITGKDKAIGLPLKKGGEPDPSTLMKKGVVLARRDTCVWARETYLKVLLKIMFDKPLYDTLDLINDEIIGMMTRQVPFIKMMVTREIGSNYKPNSNYPLKLFADELRRQGHPVEGGERIDYVFVRCEDPTKIKQGYKMRIPQMFWENCDREPLDTLHYVEKILKNPTEQILYLGYKDEIDNEELLYQPEIRRRGRIYTYISHDYINTWVKLIKYKENLIYSIKNYRPHFRSQDPYFGSTFESRIILDFN